MDYDARIDKPPVNKRGISDPVAVVTSNEMLDIAWWNEREKRWYSNFCDGNSVKADWYGDVIKWMPLPKGWIYDSELYGGLDE